MDTPEDIAKAHHWFAVECNNRAWKLAEQLSRSPAEDEEMLHCAHAAALHWGNIGTELNNARATMLLAHAHALLGDGKRALHYARASFAYVSSHDDSPPWEVALAHAVLAHAAAANDERSLHGTHYARAKSLGGALTDPGESAVFEATFRVIPAPG